MKAICAACRLACAAESPPALKPICRICPKAKLKPMNEPNVPM
ncbi:Uncharacterised protein [Nocardia africana]|uniref:Uncharacterized protein n=1 Tax=Nocardia africana TaxID=134964 RepID=A0A378WLZ3_9NOCA|nr:Uncharacterised protein [Nocardia africana]